jgi:hypothetical protein
MNTETHPAKSGNEKAHGPDSVMELLTELDQWWSFDNAQQHTHSWHDKQDFLERWRAKAAEGGDGNAETRSRVASHARICDDGGQSA